MMNTVEFLSLSDIIILKVEYLHIGKCLDSFQGVQIAMVEGQYPDYLRVGVVNSRNGA